MTADSIAAWSDRMPKYEADPKEAFESLLRMLDMPPVASVPFRPGLSQVPPKGVDREEARCDAAAFMDRDYEIYSLDDTGRGALAGDLQRGRFLTKKEMNRRLYRGRAGAVRPTESASSSHERVSAGAPGGVCQQVGGAFLDAAHLVATSPQAQPLQLTPPREERATYIFTAVPRHPDQLDFYTRQRQPETGSG